MDKENEKGGERKIQISKYKVKIIFKLKRETKRERKEESKETEKENDNK